MHRSKLFLFALIAWFSVMTVCVAQSQYQVVHLTEYMRHGARTTWLNSLNTNLTLEVGIGNLTANGVRMQYVLGAQLRETYPSIFKVPWKGTNVKVHSSSVHRTILSAASQLMGLFPLGSGEEYPLDDFSKYGLPPFEGLSVSFQNKSALPHQFRPFAYDIKSEQLDYDFFPGLYHVCPKARDYANLRTNAKLNKYQYLVIELGKEVEALGFNSKKYYNKEVHTVESLAYLFDEANSYYNYYGKYYPGISSDLHERLYRVSQLNFNFLLPDEKIQRMLADGVARNIVNAIDDVVNKRSETKFTLFSGHDTGIYTHMQLYGLSTEDCLVEKFKLNTKSTTEPCHDVPEFASPFLYELALKGEVYYVRALYIGKAFKICDENEDEYYCEFSKFVKTVEEKLYYKSDDRIEFCGNPLSLQFKHNTSTHQDIKIAIFAAAFIVLIIFVILVLILCRISKLKKNLPELGTGEYKRVNSNSPSIMIPRSPDTNDDDEKL